MDDAVPNWNILISKFHTFSEVECIRIVVILFRISLKIYQYYIFIKFYSYSSILGVLKVCIFKNFWELGTTFSKVLFKFTIFDTFFYKLKKIMSKIIKNLSMHSNKLGHPAVFFWTRGLTLWLEGALYTAHEVPLQKNFVRHIHLIMGNRRGQINKIRTIFKKKINYSANIYWVPSKCTPSL